MMKMELILTSQIKFANLRIVKKNKEKIAEKEEIADCLYFVNN